MPARTAALLGALLIALGIAVAISLPRWTAAVVAPELPTLRPEMLILPPGEFWGVGQSGPNGLTPLRRVRIPQRFALGRTEVTQAQWRAVMGGNPSYFKENGDDHPVEQVTWYAAVAYLNRLSEREGLAPCYRIKGPSGDPNSIGAETNTNFSYEEAAFTAGCTGYRLPTVAEWEYAARPGTTDPNEIAWWNENSGLTTHPVAGKQANPWFFFDLLGNVAEWTSQVEAPAGDPTRLFVAFRGCGSLDSAVACRAPYGLSVRPQTTSHTLGFRPARFLDP